MENDVKQESLISIIVPAYNAGKFIDDCIQSVVDQTMPNWELIVVDDGSNDDTPAKANKWADKDKRIRLIHQENGGVSSARNKGIDESCCQYICFVDADDRIIPQYLEFLYSSVEGSDMSIFPMKEVLSGMDIPSVFGPCESKYTEYTLQDGFEIASKRGLLHPPFCKCYKKEIIETYNIRFDESLTMGEDLLFNLAYLEHCKDMVIGETPIYLYIKGNSVLSKTIRKDYADLQIEFYKRREDFCKRHDIDYSLAPHRYAILYDAFSSIARAPNLSKNEKREALDRLKNSSLTIDYLQSTKPHGIKEYLFRMLLRNKILQKILL